MKHLPIFVLVLFSIITNVKSQGNAEIQGRIVDETLSGLPFANAVLYKNGIQEAGIQSNLDGYFVFGGLDAGVYDLKASYYDKVIDVKGIQVGSGNTVFLDDIVISKTFTFDTTIVIRPQIPVIDPGRIVGETKFTDSMISKMPVITITDVFINAGPVHTDGNGNPHVGGGRVYTIKSRVDGVTRMTQTHIPLVALQEVKVLYSGVDASDGDFTSAVFSMTTKGPSNEMHASFDFMSSQFLDPYSHNQFQFSLLGPLLKKYRKTDSARTTLGFLFTGDLQYQKDSDPPATGMWYADGQVLEALKDNPLRVSTIGEGFDKNSEFIQYSDLKKSKYKLNNNNSHAGFFGKLDYKPSLTVNMVFGGEYYASSANVYRRDFALFNSENNPKLYNESIMGYFKFHQRFISKTKTKGYKGYALGNAYYTILLDYQKRKQRLHDRNHKENTFDYGYIGSFETLREPVYTYGLDSVTGANAYLLERYRDTVVIFSPGNMNPVLSRYTDQYYQYSDPMNLDQIQSGGGLRNGDFSQSLNSYSLWYNPGVPFTSYSGNNNNQMGMRLDASFDLIKSGKGGLSKHSIQFGFEYQQRTERFYAVSPYELWTLARQNTNLHLSDMDKANPYYLVDGDWVHYSDYNGSPGQYDSIVYHRLYKATDQKYFDIALRQKLGLPVDGLDIINVDAIDPGQLTIDLFSPDELLAGGSRRVTVQGYDYHGNLDRSQTAFSDFWYKFNDINQNGVQDFGEYNTRDIGAFKPIYTAAYIQDRFNIGKITFRLGVRVDRFDANRKILRDPYSLYAIRTAKEVGTLNGSSISHPEPIGDEYSVYVNDLYNPSAITGYRNGEQWYDANGNQINDASLIVGQSGGTGKVSPYLVDATQDIKQDGLFDVNQSFMDYKPQITIMPRIAFSFAITETAMFTAHYDVLSQRPAGRNSATPYHYYYLQEIAIDGVIPNPNLKPEKTINYQLGFQQALNKQTALKFSAFYRELRDMVQIVKVNFAYPVEYTTYGNVDFGTVKGLIVEYSMIRRVKNLLMSASYTLQYADGTGSNTTSQINLISAGQPNLRTIVPMDYDVRHTFNINLDYRFASGKRYNGPKLSGKDILANAGINISARGRTGEPYTRQGNPVPTAQFGVRSSSSLKGKINGSRLPFYFNMDMRLDKDFRVSGKGKNPVFLNVYFLAQNLLNTRNVFNVYSYTGSAEDDGYIASPFSSETIIAQVDPDAFVEQYEMKVANPDNFSRPRRLQLGAALRF